MLLYKQKVIKYIFNFTTSLSVVDISHLRKDYIEKPGKDN